MGKIGVSATKYVIEAEIETTGVVERPDVIGAIFGQTEGLLGKELELRELQKSGRIGRIEVKVTSANGKTTGIIEIPTSLSKEDTALIAASLETIERIGPSDSKVKINKIEDVRTAKRDFLVDRAKTLLANLGQESPQSGELSNQIKVEIRTEELKEYGPAKLAGGPDLEKQKDLILVEGRADVINMLKNNIPNVLSVGGTNIHPSLKDLCAGKEITVFLDGDRGGDLILKSLMQFVKVEYVARALQGFEVEELPQKELLKALRNKVTIESAMREQANQQYSSPAPREYAHEHKPAYEGRRFERRPDSRRGGRPRMLRDSPDRRSDRGAPRERREHYAQEINFENVEFKPEYKVLGKIAAGMAGSGDVCLLKQSGNNFREIGKVPKGELSSVMRNLQTGAAHAMIVDGPVDQLLITLAASKGIKYLLGHRKPYTIKRTPGLTVLSIRDIVAKTSPVAPKDIEIPPAPAPPKPASPLEKEL